MNEKERTRVAVLGTLAEFHKEPIPYDMPALLELVAEINPDLLLLDMTAEQWQEQDFSALPPEYQEALLPLAHQTDIVVAPIGGGQSPPKPEAGGWRGAAIKWLRRRIATIQRKAPGPDAINQGWRHHLANYYYGAARWLAGSDVDHTTHEHTDHLTQATLEVARRDPGVRVLVVVNVQHCHIIRERLRHYEDLDVTTYTEL
jgi:L-ascorbate metabolism protein UlaG (beta-lactamase superfamily)